MNMKINVVFDCPWADKGCINFKKKCSQCTYYSSKFRNYLKLKAKSGRVLRYLQKN